MPDEILPHLPNPARKLPDPKLPCFCHLHTPENTASVYRNTTVVSQREFPSHSRQYSAPALSDP